MRIKVPVCALWKLLEIAVAALAAQRNHDPDAYFSTYRDWIRARHSART